MAVNAFYNERAEKAVLSLFSTDTAFQQGIADLSPEDFADEDHRKIFKAMQNLAAEKKGIDLVTLSTEMSRMYGAEEKKLTDLLLDIVTNWGLCAQYAYKDHIEIIKKSSVRRKMLEVVDSAKKDLTQSDDDTDVVLDKLRQELREIVSTAHTWKTLNGVFIDTYNCLERRAKGEEPSMPSGLCTLDATTTGFHKGELTIIGARPAVGKSALGAYIALSTAKNGYKVGVVSREMTSVQYGIRVIQQSTTIDSKNLRSGDLKEDEWFQIASVPRQFYDKCINFLFTCRYVEDLRQEVQKKVDEGQLDMLLIDYVQLLQTKKKFEKDYLRIGYISKMLKDMTTDFNISIISLAQVGRATENTMPSLADLRGSGDLEQDADNVIFMHKPIDSTDRYVRPEDRQLFENLKADGRQYIALKIAKQRQGETGVVPIVFNPSRMQFTAIANE